MSPANYLPNAKVAASHPSQLCDDLREELLIWEFNYERPILIAETGSEAGAEFGWLCYVIGEVRQAGRLGVPVQGVCLDPVMITPAGITDGIAAAA